MKNFEQFNESIKDKMTPKPTENIRNSLYEYFDEDMVTNEGEYVLETGVFDQDIITKKELYFIFDWEDYFETADEYFRNISYEHNNYEMTIYNDNYICFPDKKIVFYEGDGGTDGWYFDVYNLRGLIDYMMDKELNESVKDKMLPISKAKIRELIGDPTPNAKLVIATQKGLSTIVEEALKEGADIKIVSGHYFGFACSNGFDDVVKLLIDNGVDIHADNEWAIKMAVERFRVNIVRMLLDAGADIHVSKEYLIGIAVEECVSRLERHSQEQIDTIKLLLKYGAVVDDRLISFVKAHGDNVLLKILSGYKVNESLRDFMKPKSKDDIKEILDKLPERERIVKGIKMELYTDRDVDEMLKGLSPREYFIRSVMIERDLPVHKRRLVDKAMTLIKPYKKVRIGDLLTVPPTVKSNFILNEIEEPKSLLEIIHKVTFFNRDEFNKFLKEYQQSTSNDVIADRYIGDVYHINSWKKMNCVVAVMKNRNRYGSFERRKNTYIVYDYGQTTGVFRYTKEEIDEYETIKL